MSKVYMLPHEVEPILRRQLVGVLGQILLQKQGVPVDNVDQHKLRVARTTLLHVMKAIRAQKAQAEPKESIHSQLRRSIDAYLSKLRMEGFNPPPVLDRSVTVISASFKLTPTEAVKTHDIVNSESAFFDDIIKP